MPPKRQRVNINRKNTDGTGGVPHNIAPDPVQNFVNLLRETLQNPVPNQNPQVQDQNAHVTPFKAFKGVHPPEFNGTTDPTEAQSWIKEIEKAFNIVQVADNQKTNFAIYMLKGEANFWWESKEAREEQVVTWDRFKELFFEKYFPQIMKNKMEMQFLELKQGDMTVEHYEAKFTELARFAPHQVDTEKRKARRFEQGLKPWIYNKVSVFETKKYNKLVQKAIIAESGSEAFHKYKDERKGKDDHGYNNRNQRCKTGANDNNYNQGSNTKTQNSNQLYEPYKECSKCGKRHGGVICFRGTRNCFKCGQLGHLSPDCPRGWGIKCYNCGGKGHIARDCPKGRTTHTEGTEEVKQLSGGVPTRNRATARTYNMAASIGAPGELL